MPKPINKKKGHRFYENLRAEMARKGLSVIDTAEKIGLSRQSFHLRLCGAVKFTFDEAKKLADLLGADVDYLMEFKERKGTDKK